MIRTITGLGLLTALVVLLQYLGGFIRFGVFSVSLVLIPIVIGAALYGPWAGAWLGLVFGGVVFLTGDANAFLAISVPGTIVTVILKGVLAGLCAGFVYRLLEKKNDILATFAAAAVCPIVNTGIFLLGCRLFFYDTVRAWGEAAGYDNVFVYMMVGFVGLNFLMELAFNLVLSPAVVRLVKLIRMRWNRRGASA